MLANPTLVILFACKAVSACEVVLFYNCFAHVDFITVVLFIVGGGCRDVLSF
jgi:hypothetical protein